MPTAGSGATTGGSRFGSPRAGGPSAASAPFDVSARPASPPAAGSCDERLDVAHADLALGRQRPAQQVRVDRAGRAGRVPYAVWPQLLLDSRRLFGSSRPSDRALVVGRRVPVVADDQHRGGGPPVERPAVGVLVLHGPGVAGALAVTQAQARPKYGRPLVGLRGQRRASERGVLRVQAVGADDTR